MFCGGRNDAGARGRSGVGGGGRLGSGRLVRARARSLRRRGGGTLALNASAAALEFA